MLDRIVVAVDGSPESQRAVEAAAELATKGDGKVLAVHVREATMVVGGDYGVATVVEGEPADDAQTLVDKIVDQLRKAGADVKGQVIDGPDVTRALLEVANGFSAGVIVMGSRGLSDFGGLILGSVAHKLIHLAKCPVLVVR